MGGSMGKLGDNLASNFQTPQGTTGKSVLGGIGNTVDMWQASGQKPPGQQQPGQSVNFAMPNQTYIPPPDPSQQAMPMQLPQQRNPFYGGF